MPKLKNRKARLILWAIAIVVIIAIGVYIITHGQEIFSRNILRFLLRFIRSYGSFSPLIVVALILISTSIPPLPLPVPLIEIAAGLVFGFWPGFFVVWFSQILSSVAAFAISRYFGKRLFGRVLNNHIWNLYQKFLHRKGPLAVFIIRATMAAPFNIISYLAGLTQMNVGEFTGVTTLGVIPESVLFTFIGSSIRTYHFNLFHILVLTVVSGVLGWLLTLFIMKLLQPEIGSEVKSS